jgi:hypothetical protein
MNLRIAFFSLAALTLAPLAAQAQFTGTTYAAFPLGLNSGSLNNLANADSAIANGAVQGSASYGDVDWLDSAAGGNLGGNHPAPGVSNADDFTVQTLGTFFSLSATYRFTGNSDDGQRLRIDGIDVFVDDVLAGPHDKSGDIHLSNGFHTFDYVWFERGGGAEGELGYRTLDGGVPSLSSMSASIVPEPTSFVLFGLGAAGLFAVARRRKA